MLTKKQVESLPKGHYTASQLRAMFPPKKKETKSEKKEITPGKGLLEVAKTEGVQITINSNESKV